MEQLVESMRADRGLNVSAVVEYIHENHDNLEGFLSVREFHKKHDYPNFHKLIKLASIAHRYENGLSHAVKKVKNLTYLNELLMLEWLSSHVQKEIDKKGVGYLLDRQKHIASTVCELKNSEV